MVKTLPGTAIETEFTPDTAMTTINNLFIAGGLMLSQLSRLTGLEPYVIQNWVRRGFLPPPEKKLYSKEQFCRIVIINMLKQSFQIESITGLLSLINGHLDDESDDSIKDSDLYYLFLQTICRTDVTAEFNYSEALLTDERLDTFIKRGDKATAARRIRQATELMFYAYQSSVLRMKAELLMKEID